MDWAWGRALVLALTQARVAPAPGQPPASLAGWGRTSGMASAVAHLGADPGGAPFSLGSSGEPHLLRSTRFPPRLACRDSPLPR